MTDDKIEHCTDEDLDMAIDYLYRYELGHEGTKAMSDIGFPVSRPEEPIEVDAGSLVPFQQVGLPPAEAPTVETPVAPVKTDE